MEYELYELETPIIEELDAPVILQCFDNSIVEIQGEVAPKVVYRYEATIPFKEAIVEQKEEVHTNLLDVESNILPYLMDMEYNLMTMEVEDDTAQE